MPCREASDDAPIRAISNARVRAVAASLFAPFVGIALYAATALMWLVPDRGVARALHQGDR